MGREINKLLAKGELVPDDITTSMVRDRLRSDDVKNGYIMDGFPRTLKQADTFATFADIDCVMNFSLSDDKIIQRLSGRRTCSACGNMHHIEFVPPLKEGICDVCGGPLIIREDDKPESIRRRLDVYMKQTEPLINYYEKTGTLRTIDAGEGPEKVAEQVRIFL